MQEVPKVDELITDGTKNRDAIHVAIAPVSPIWSSLSAGAPIRFLTDGEYRDYLSDGTRDDGDVTVPRIEAVTECELDDVGCIGVISPYLKSSVHVGERCYVFLLPNTVTSLRHAWVCPKFTAVMTESLRSR